MVVNLKPTRLIKKYFINLTINITHSILNRNNIVHYTVNPLDCFIYNKILNLFMINLKKFIK